MPTTIACNALALRPGGGGVSTYIRELLAALSRAGSVGLEAHVQRDALQELPDGVQPRAHPVHAGARRALTGLALRHQGGLMHGLDVDLPLRSRTPTVATVHDVSVFDTPWAFPRARALGEQVLVRRAVTRADAVLAVSAFTAQRVRDLFGRDSEVTPLAPAPQMRPPTPEEVDKARVRYDLVSPFVLQVGTVEPRKNVAALGRVCRREGLTLVLAGAVAPGQAVPAGARHLGYVPASDLPSLYRSATVVAYPSVYEGFGLPPVEAMACGGVVVTSAVGGLPEAVGDGAVLVQPHDEEGLRAALVTLVADEGAQQELRSRAVAAAARLSWARTAETTLAVYRRLGVAC